MNCKFLNSAEKKELLAQLGLQFGIKELNYLLIETGKEKIRAFSGSLSKEELLDLAQSVNIEIMGLYIVRKEHDIRLSFDATQLLSKQVENNIVEITDEQLALWIRGQDINIKEAPRGTVIIKHGSDFFGCGKSTGERIINHVPKERRIRSNSSR